MEPVTALGVLSLILNIMCAALNLIRGIHLAEHSLQVTSSLQFRLKDTWWKQHFILTLLCAKVFKSKESV